MVSERTMATPECAKERRKLVKQFKDKLLKEITDYREICDAELQEYVDKNPDFVHSHWYNYSCFQRVYALGVFEEFVKDPNTFLATDSLKKHPEDVWYVIPNDEIRLWLEDDSNFTRRFIDYILKTVGTVGMVVCLHEKFFGYSASEKLGYRVEA